MKEHEDYEEEMSFPIDAQVHRVYDYKRYSFHRINRILKQFYGCKLKKVCQGYKASRKWGYQELYQVVDMRDGEVVCDWVTLEQLRHFLAEQDYPLYDERSAANKKAAP